MVPLPGAALFLNDRDGGSKSLDLALKIQFPCPEPIEVGKLQEARRCVAEHLGDSKEGFLLWPAPMAVSDRPADILDGVGALCPLGNLGIAQAERGLAFVKPGEKGGEIVHLGRITEWSNGRVR